MIFDNLHSSVLTTIPELQGAFLAVNALYALDRHCPQVNIDMMRELLISHETVINSCKYKVALIHHHILGQFAKDNSVIRNAYDFVRIMDEFDFNFVLHGHQHTAMHILLGSTPTNVIAVNSFNCLQVGYVNTVNVYDLKNRGT